VAVEDAEADGCADEDDIEEDGDAWRCVGCDGTDSDVERGVAEAEGDAGVADEDRDGADAGDDDEAAEGDAGGA